MRAKDQVLAENKTHRLASMKQLDHSGPCKTAKRLSPSGCITREDVSCVVGAACLSACGTGGDEVLNLTRSSSLTEHLAVFSGVPKKSALKPTQGSNSETSSIPRLASTAAVLSRQFCSLCDHSTLAEAPTKTRCAYLDPAKPVAKRT